MIKIRYSQVSVRPNLWPISGEWEVATASKSGISAASRSRACVKLATLASHTSVANNISANVSLFSHISLSFASNMPIHYNLRKNSKR